MTKQGLPAVLINLFHAGAASALPQGQACRNALAVVENYAVAIFFSTPSAGYDGRTVY